MMQPADSHGYLVDMYAWLKRTCFCLALGLASSGLLSAQTEAEAPNAIELQVPNRTARRIIPAGSHLRVYLKPGDNIGYAAGRLEQVGDSSFIVTGDTVRVQDVESIDRIEPTSKLQGGRLLLLSALLGVLTVVIAAYWIPLLGLSLLLLFAFLLANLLFTFGLAALIMAIVKFATYSQHIVWSRFSYRPIHWKGTRVKTQKKEKWL